MRSRPSIALSPADRTTVARWSACMTSAILALIAAVLVPPVFKGHADNGGSVRRVQSAPNAICASLDRLASSVIAERAQNQPIDVAEISDMIASMRRGRRICEIGWPQLACREYQAILDRAQTSASDSSDRFVGCLETAVANKSTPPLQ
jgi:hypothetical protein